MIEKWVEKRWHTIKTYKHGWNRIFLSCTKQHMKLLSKALKRENSSSSSYLLLKNVEHFRRMIFNFHHDGVVLIVVDWKKFSTANTMNHEPWKVYLCNVFKIPNALNRIERTKNQLNVSKIKHSTLFWYTLIQMSWISLNRREGKFHLHVQCTIILFTVWI